MDNRSIRQEKWSAPPTQIKRRHELDEEQMQHEMWKEKDAWPCGSITDGDAFREIQDMPWLASSLEKGI